MDDEKKRRQAPRLSRAAGVSLVERWRRSGLTRSEFCRREYVSKHVLRYWLQQADDVSDKPKREEDVRGDFVVVTAPQEPTSGGTGTQRTTAAAAANSAAKTVVVVVPVQPGVEALSHALRAILREASR